MLPKPVERLEEPSDLRTREAELEQRLSLDNLRWVIANGNFSQWDREAQYALGLAVGRVLSGGRSHE